MRAVDGEALTALVGGNLTAAARKIDPSAVQRVRRKLQRALKKGTLEQASADEIAEGLGVNAESFLRPVEVLDARVLELRRLGRKASRIRRELGWDPGDFEDGLASPNG